MSYAGLLTYAGTWYVVAAPAAGLGAWAYSMDWLPGLCAFGAFLLWGAALAVGGFILKEQGTS